MTFPGTSSLAGDDRAATSSPPSGLETPKTTIKPVSRMDCARFICDIHYAKRWPSISFAFGLFLDDILEGVVTFGTPCSAPLRSGICGPEYSANVLELNRLCLISNTRNHASQLTTKAIKLLGGDRIIVSFADTEQSHLGIVYQACSFLYCGLSAKRTDWKIKGKEHMHGQTVADEFRGCEGRAALMRSKYGDDFYLHPRPRKHRYIKIIGSKGFRAKSLRALRYPVEPYPKAAS